MSSVDSQCDLILWGATGQAKVLNELVWGTRWKVVALVDNREIAAPLAGIPMLRGEPEFLDWLQTRSRRQPLHGAVAVGGHRGMDRLQLMSIFDRHAVSLPTLVHRTAFVANDSIIGKGGQILAHASVCSHAIIGRGVVVNTAASVDHDCVVEDGVHIGPGARLAGEVKVGRYAFIGIGAAVLPRLTIGESAIVGAGAVVTRNVEPGTVVVGNPARAMKVRNA